jgi:transketolase
MLHMAGNRQPTYLQLVRLKMPKLFEEDCRFDPSAPCAWPKAGVTLVATGFMTRFALDAARAGGGGDRRRPAPLPVRETLRRPETLIDSARRTGGVVTVENQSIIGGWAARSARCWPNITR